MCIEATNVVASAPLESLYRVDAESSGDCDPVPSEYAPAPSPDTSGPLGPFTRPVALTSKR